MSPRTMPAPKLITAEQRRQLEANGRKTAASPEGKGSGDLEPVVKVFNPCGTGTWLITEIVPDTDGDLLFGLADLGYPELGYMSLSALESVRTHPFGLPLERDRWFKPKHSIREYARIARQKGAIDA